MIEVEQSTTDDRGHCKMCGRLRLGEEVLNIEFTGIYSFRICREHAGQFSAALRELAAACFNFGSIPR